MDILTKIEKVAVADPVFPWGTPIPEGGTPKLLSKTERKYERIGPRGGAILAPPWIRHWVFSTFVQDAL